MWESMGEVWKSVWGEYRGCVEVRESVLGCGGASTLFYTSPHILHTLQTPLPTLTQHLSPASPHSPDTSLHTFPHSLPTSPHSVTLPNSLHTFPSPAPTLSHNPHASSNTSLCSSYFFIYPIPKFLTFLIYCQISLTIKYRYTRNSL